MAARRIRTGTFLSSRPNRPALGPCRHGSRSHSRPQHRDESLMSPELCKACSDLFDAALLVHVAGNFIGHLFFLVTRYSDPVQWVALPGHGAGTAKGQRPSKAA